MKALITFLIVSGIFLSSPHAQAQADTVDKIIAVVDNKVITQSDVDHEMKTASVQGKQATRSQIVQNLINARILEAEMEKENIKVEEDEIQAAIKEILEANKKTSAQLEADLKKNGMSLMQFQDNIRKDLRERKFVQQKLSLGAHISDYDLQEFYRKHKHKYKTYDNLRFKEIFLVPQSIPRGQDPMKFAENLVEQLRKGSDWAAAAQKYSRGAFAAKGGDSGLISVDSMQEQLKNVLLSLPMDQVSNPLPTPNGGIFIFKVVDLQNPKPRPFFEVKEAMRQELIQKRVGDEMENYLMDARSRHFVEIRS